MLLWVLPLLAAGALLLATRFGHRASRSLGFALFAVAYAYAYSRVAAPDAPTSRWSPWLYLAYGGLWLAAGVSALRALERFLAADG